MPHFIWTRRKMADEFYLPQKSLSRKHPMKTQKTPEFFADFFDPGMIWY